MNNSELQIIVEKPILEVSEPSQLVVESTGVKIQTGGGGTLTLERPNIELLSIGSQGPKGLTGDKGDKGDHGEDSDKTYVHTQISAASTWTVVHNLNKFPSVTVVDSGDTAVIGDVTYVDVNTLTLDFTTTFGGSAYLN